MLRSAEGYVSGQQLCNQLKVSRTAVWKVIEQLKAEGYDIEAVHGKGYHLVSVPDVISQAEIESSADEMGRMQRFLLSSHRFY